MRIEVELQEPRASGSLAYTFDAAGFGPPPKCDPARKPTFKLDQVEPTVEESGEAETSQPAAK